MAAPYSAARAIRPTGGNAPAAVPAGSDSRGLPLPRRTVSFLAFAARLPKAPELSELATQIPRHITALDRDAASVNQRMVSGASWRCTGLMHGARGDLWSVSPISNIPNQRRRGHNGFISIFHERAHHGEASARA